MNRTFSPKGSLVGIVMPKDILSLKQLSLGAKMTYAVMVACSQQGKDFCFPSHTYLAKTIGISLRSVQTYIRELVQLALIKTSTQKAGTVLRYYFLENKDVFPQQATAPITKTDASGRYANFAEGYANSADVYNKDIKYNIPPLPPVTPAAIPSSASRHNGGDLSSLFQKLWSMWPRKQDYKNSYFVWQRLFRTKQLPASDLLFAKIDELSRLDGAWQRGAVPCLSKWLRDERWTDVPVPALSSRSVSQETPYSQPQMLQITPREAESLLEAFKEKSRKETEAIIQRGNGGMGIGDFMHLKQLNNERRSMCVRETHRKRQKAQSMA